ncbi:hypothetical protein [Ornithinimicrobium sp. INDO-MA30-4]|nr:hypothetical protein [Ornithinimicrobium sp. INDO-MA30-4]UJH71239.1 hypothetical protein L0A91_05405 [Ornithinimicrobium sp. INDO-MA30-4]
MSTTTEQTPLQVGDRVEVEVGPSLMAATALRATKAGCCLSGMPSLASR